MPPSFPRVLLHLEGAAVLAVATWAYAEAGPGWVWFAVLFLAPDLAMVGYAGGPRAGAVAYNLAHSYAGPALLLGLAVLGAFPAGWWVAPLWAAHVGFDRMLGYGLKYASAFKDTHLARV